MPTTDDLASVVITVSALNLLTSICDKFPEQNYINFKNIYSACMCTLPQRSGIGSFTNVCLSVNAHGYVNSSEYLGHVT